MTAVTVSSGLDTFSIRLIRAFFQLKTIFQMISEKFGRALEYPAQEMEKSRPGTISVPGTNAFFPLNFVAILFRIFSVHPSGFFCVKKRGKNEEDFRAV